MPSTKRFAAKALAVAAAAASLTAAATLAVAAPAGAANAPAHVSRFDGSYSGAAYHYVTLTSRQQAISPAQLGKSGSATFTTTITANKNAAQWNSTKAELIIAGLRQAKPAKSSSKYFGDGSLIYAQDNSMGAGYCANDQFLNSSGTFVFGNRDACYSHTTPPYGSTETYSVTITGSNTFTDTVSNSSSGGTYTASFTGNLSLPKTTRYYPAVYMLPGRTTTTPNSKWTFTVSNSSYNVSKS